MKIQGFAPRLEEGATVKVESGKMSEFKKGVAYSVDFWRRPVMLLTVVLIVLGVATGIGGLIVVCTASLQAPADIDAIFSLGYRSISWGGRFLLACFYVLAAYALFEKFLGRKPREFIREVFPKIARATIGTAVVVVLVCAAIAMFGFF